MYVLIYQWHIGIISSSTSWLCNVAKNVSLWHFSLDSYTMKKATQGYVTLFAVLFGSVETFGFEHTPEIDEKKKTTPSIASITSFNSNLLEAICCVASSRSSFRTLHVARHVTARCLGNNILYNGANDGVDGSNGVDGADADGGGVDGGSAEGVYCGCDNNADGSDNSVGSGGGDDGVGGGDDGVAGDVGKTSTCSETVVEMRNVLHSWISTLGENMHYIYVYDAKDFVNRNS
ncbi:Hypothetical predicted protein [Paramuricea clavata]|uniref:Uncharacterized protein n=1 Tax=Paramuricea clavata TaxID=317549 RepID=A0A6S7J9X4_PARCT|nr:Hypothetical predicted protein [Paramuricea clavata]